MLAKQITEKLKAELNCSELTVHNESHLHAGHNGFDGSGESHFKIEIASPDFSGLSRLEIHRKINFILKNELKYIHALAIKIIGL